MLTELRCRSASKQAKPYKLHDEKGLYLYVAPSGHRSWRMKYRFGGGEARREKTLTFGPYPELSLKKAREKRDQARALLRDGIDPGEKKRLESAPGGAAGPTFDSYARRWHADQAALWKPVHADQVLTSLEKNVFPAIGSKPIGDVRPGDVRKLLLAIQDRGSVDIAHRVRGRLSSVFARAIADELVEMDPAAAVAAVLQPVKSRRMPALVKLDQARAFLRAVEAAPSHPVTKLASRLVALTALRPGVIRFTPRTGEFQDLEGEAPLWHIPAERMKLELDESEQEAFDHLAPLARQAVDVIQVAQRLAGRAPWLFPSIRQAHKPISENALSYAYKRIKGWEGKHVPHGWRSSFSSVMNDLAAQLDRAADADVIERMLAHQPKGIRGIYNRAAYMPRRREIAQEWADMLLKGFPPAEQLLEGPRH
ncbi:integrase arm-type DNA-binding domain-containing protein [Sphingosinicella sp. CPCC 101087]|uniref:tyrosine-type recombinase/integrase n=1 Tax=Sphingosinicella sp. CPCC 101087 TaxID=2497754 RepID=UPI00101CACF7|nr:integrase arm-type DNA-binding domain-containing protein [Sphingosinicella sp. CPCC 101087]